MRLFLTVLAGLLALVLVAEAAVLLHGAWRVGRLEAERARFEKHLPNWDVRLPGPRGGASS